MTSSKLTASDPAFRAVVDDVLHRLSAAKDVEELRSPYDERTISADGHSALIKFEVPGTQTTAGDKVAPALAATAAAAAAHPGFTIGEAGEASFAKVYDETQGEDFKRAETLSLPLTLLILVFAFGGLVAAGIPVLLAMSAVGAAGGLTALTSHLLPVTDVTQSVILLIGLAVGVDYSIFYLARERRERARGTTTIDAIEIAAATLGTRRARVRPDRDRGHERHVLERQQPVRRPRRRHDPGRAVRRHRVADRAARAAGPKSAGFLARIPGAAIVGRGFRAVGRGIAAVWSVITWPLRALAGVVRRARGERTIWQRVLGPVLRHPVISVVASSAVLIVLALPALGLTLGLAPATYGMSKDLPVMQAKAQIEKAFPGSPSPAVVVLEAKDVTTTEVGDAVRRFEQAAVASGQARAPFTTRVSDDHTVIALVVPIAGDGHDAAGHRRDAGAPRPHRPDGVPRAQRHHRQHHGRGGRRARLQHADARSRAAGDRVRAARQLPAAARHVPLAGRADQGDRAQPAQRRCRLRHPRGGVPEQLGRGHPRLRERRRDRVVAADLPVRGAVRTLDGLPRVHRQPHPRAVGSRHADPHRGRGGHHGDGRRRHLRGPRHDRRVRRLRDAHRPRHEAARRRPRLGDPHRRDDRPGGAAAGRDVAARRRQLVPAAHARWLPRISHGQPALEPAASR